jgi:pyridoxamine 5'-phosphate oxidase family protein
MEADIMSAFSDAELAYLKEAKLGRLATVDAKGQPHVVPVGWSYNADTIDIGGHDFGRTRKFRNVQEHPFAAFVVDDVLPPWSPRAVQIRGPAEAIADARPHPDQVPARRLVDARPHPTIPARRLADARPHPTIPRR